MQSSEVHSIIFACSFVRSRTVHWMRRAQITSVLAAGVVFSSQTSPSLIVECFVCARSFEAFRNKTPVLHRYAVVPIVFAVKPDTKIVRGEMHDSGERRQQQPRSETRAMLIVAPYS